MKSFVRIIAVFTLFFLGIFYISGSGHSVVLAVYDDAHSHHSHDTDDTNHEFYHTDDITSRGKFVSTYDIVLPLNRFTFLYSSLKENPPVKIPLQQNQFHEKQRLAFFETIRLLL